MTKTELQPATEYCFHFMALAAFQFLGLKAKDLTGVDYSVSTPSPFLTRNHSVRHGTVLPGRNA